MDTQNICLHVYTYTQFTKKVEDTEYQEHEDALDTRYVNGVKFLEEKSTLVLFCCSLFPEQAEFL